jgi:hypothetical protein
MRKEVAFIGCSATKTEHSGRAADVYLGKLFKWSLAYCQQQGFDCVLILSAKYGVLELNDIIEPYNETLKTKNKKERDDWAVMVERQIREKGLRLRKRYYFCGNDYHGNLKAGETPFARFKGIGYILQWLKEQTRKQGFFDG